jgi:F-type H+-transporting ATPase subunit b
MKALAWLSGAIAALAPAGFALAKEGEGGAPYFGDLGQAIAAMLTFAVLVLVLGKWVWKPIVRQLERREEAIQTSIENAEKRQREAEEALEEYKSQLAQARTQAQQIVAEGQRRAADERKVILEKAEEQAGELTEEAREEIRRAKEEAVQDLRDLTASMATELASRLIGRKLSPEDHERLVDESLEEIRERTLRNP